MTNENNKWRHFLKLFDSTFFRMAFQFIAILFIVFLILMAVSYYEAGGSRPVSPISSSDSIRQ